MLTENEKKMIDILSDPMADGKDIANAISMAMNSFIIHSDELIKALQENEKANAIMDMISWNWIKVKADDFSDNNYDGRNEIAVRKCYEINSEIKEGCITKPSTKREMTILLILTREHRTIQQSLTGFIFLYLRKTSEYFREITERIGKGDIGMLPMI